MTLLFPGFVVRKSLVWQAGQAEPGVADPDALVFVRHHLRGDIYQRALPFWRSLPRPLSTVDEHSFRSPSAASLSATSSS